MRAALMRDDVTLMREVVWSDPNSGDNALPWDLVRISNSGRGSLRATCRN
jgi:hypothetical protein